MVSPNLDGLERELLTLADQRLMDPLEILLDTPELVAQVRERLQAQVSEWAGDLLGDDDTAAVSTASRLVAVLFDGDDFSPPESWWQTSFGRIVARRVAYPGRSTLTGVEAAAMLGITRQGVHDLARRGKLDTAADGRLVTVSVQSRLRAAD